MKYSAYGGVPTLAAALALYGCSALDHRTESTLPSGAASVDTGMHPRTTADRSDSSDTSMKSLHDIRAENQRLKLNLHIFGLSYHPDRNGAHLSHLDNELNIGLGLGYKFHHDARGDANLEAGFFKDSGRNWARFAGAGYQFKINSRWKMGADLLIIQSPTYNKGRSFVAPIPRLTYDFGAVKLNTTYLPRVQKYNQFAVFVVYLTIPIRK